MSRAMLRPIAAVFLLMTGAALAQQPADAVRAQDEGFFRYLGRASAARPVTPFIGWTAGPDSDSVVFIGHTAGPAASDLGEGSGSSMPGGAEAPLSPEALAAIAARRDIHPAGD